MALVFFQLFNLFNSRSASTSVFAMKVTNNKWLLMMFGLASILQLGALYLPGVASVLGLTALSLPTVALCLAVAVSIVLVDELRKLGRVMVLSWAKTQASFD